MPSVARWPGKFLAGTVCNEIMSHMDRLPTLLAAAGEPDIKEQLKAGHQAGEKTFKVHLDGYNFLPLIPTRLADMIVGAIIAVSYSVWSKRPVSSEASDELTTRNG